MRFECPFPFGPALMTKSDDLARYAASARSITASPGSTSFHKVLSLR